MYAKKDNLIYEIKLGLRDDVHTQVNLNLVCGWDYINPDENDIQGYVSSDKFIDNVQYDLCSWLYWDESLKECLIDNDYEIVEKLPKIN